MKTKLLLVLLAIALVAGTAQSNMLVNPGFEDGNFTGFNSHTPEFWAHYWTDYSPQHAWVNDSDEAHLGEKYMRMYNWVAYGNNSSAYLGQTLDVKEGKDYYFSVWAKNAAEGQTNIAAIDVEWRDTLDNLIGINNWISSDSIYIPLTDPDWIKVDFGAATAPEGAIAAAIWLTAHLGNGLNAVCYDDASMIGPDPNINAGPDMVSWDDQTVSLTGSELLEDEYATIAWTAEPAFGAVITDGDTLTPTVEVDCIIESGLKATIANHSFENGLDNWVTVSGEGHGTWNGITDPNGVIYITPTDGFMCGYLDGVTGEEAGVLSQVLVNTLAADTTYTLTVDVANDGYDEENVEYKVQLLAEGTVLAEDDDNHFLDTYGDWATSTVVYTCGESDPNFANVGEPLEIRLIAKEGTGNDMNFDNVHLTADSPFPAYVPDILTLTMTLEIDGDKYDTMKIDVYPDACAAKLGAGLREATDLVGDDCITDLTDLAELAATWADDNALTEPMAKDLGPEAGWRPIAIANAGFEDPPQEDGDYDNECFHPPYGYHWTVIDYYAGVWNPDATGEVWYGYEGIVPEGENLAYVEEASSITQVLTDTLKANTNYMLALYVGNMNYYDGGTYTVELLAGGTPLVSHSEEVNNIEDDKFELRTIKYECHPDHTALVGRPLEIRLGMSDPGGNVEVDFDDVRLGFKNLFIIFPEDRAYVCPAGELELNWPNMDPFDPNDPEVVYDPNGPVWVDVWFGMDPNDFNKVVDAVEDANSATVDVSTLGTYYWQVNSYIYGDPAKVDYDTGDPNANDPNVIKGPMWEFHVVTDPPVSVEVGDYWVTWSGQAVQLDATVDDDGASPLTIAWSTNDPNNTVFSATDIEDPTVTITKVTDNPSIVMLTLSAYDGVNSDEDTMTIEVYDTACLAAIGEGIAELDPGDVDQDCDTDLGDFAAMAEEWLVYSELAGSIVKP